MQGLAQQAQQVAAAVPEEWALEELEVEVQEARCGACRSHT